MDKALAEEISDLQSESLFGKTEERTLTLLCARWREDGGLTATDERQFAFLIRQLVMSRAAELLDVDAFIQILRPFGGESEFSDDEKRMLIRQFKPLLKQRKLTSDEQEELARLFERYRMRLWSKLRRSIGAALESQFGPEDVLSEAYIRAESRWFARPEDPDKYYVWLYGIVHEQFYDMLRRVNAVKRGGLVDHLPLPDNSAAEIALELWQSQTGASTVAARNEFISRLQGFLERNLSRSEIEIFSMRVFDRLEYPEIATELVRRAEESDRSADYETILSELDSRAQAGDWEESDVSKRRAGAIRKRFTRAVGRLSGAILNEFPELLDALPRLSSENTRSVKSPSGGDD